MRIIDHRQFGKKPKSSTRSRKVRLLFIIGGAVIGIFLLVNIGIWIAYKDKALPNTRFGAQQIGGMSFKDISALKQADVLPKTITLTRDKIAKELHVADAGITVDIPASIETIKKRSWLPAIDLITKHHAPLVLQVNDMTYAKALDTVRADFSKEPTDKHVAFNGQDFVIEQGQDGYRIQDGILQKNILSAIKNDKSGVTVPTEVIKTVIHDVDLTGEVNRLQKEVATKLSFIHQGQTVRPGIGDIGAWYVPNGQSLAFSPEAFQAYLTAQVMKGSAPTNASDLSLATQYALSHALDANLVASSPGARNRTYCVASRGANEALLQDMIGKLAFTYADARGWNNNGSIAFVHTPNQCQYTVWLAAPSQMTSFGAICDDYYNCQVGTSVIVNSDRWLYGTDAWNATGRSIEEYRSLIINHETGHRLGLYDNNVCSAPGQLAPVMMQQSIDLMGCAFNPWPLPNELQAV